MNICLLLNYISYCSFNIFLGKTSLKRENTRKYYGMDVSPPCQHFPYVSVVTANVRQAPRQNCNEILTVEFFWGLKGAKM